jgi:hypothetical protein
VRNKGTIWGVLLLLLVIDLITLLGYALFSISLGNDFILNEQNENTLLIIFCGLGLLVSAMAICKFGQGKTLLVGCFLATVPLVFAFALITAKIHLVVEREKPQALYHYDHPLQQDIALAIEHGDTELLTELMLHANGVDKVGKSDKVSSYLQVAVETNCLNGEHAKSFENIVKILLQSGIRSCDALKGVNSCISPEVIPVLLDFGLNPNGIKGRDPLIFDMVGKGEKGNAMVLLILNKGVDIDVRNSKGQTLVMAVAQMAAKFPTQKSNWRLVYQLLELRANFTCTARDNSTLGSILRSTKVKAAQKNQKMPADFFIVLKWMTDHHYVDVPF